VITKAPTIPCIYCHTKKKVKLAHTRLPSVGLRSWSRFLAASLQVTWVINPVVGCHYFPPSLQLPSQPSKDCYQFCWLVNRGTMGVNSLPKRRDCDLNPGPSAPESSTLTTRLPSHTTLWKYLVPETAMFTKWVKQYGMRDSSCHVRFDHLNIVVVKVRSGDVSIIWLTDKTIFSAHTAQPAEWLIIRICVINVTGNCFCSQSSTCNPPSSLQFCQMFTDLKSFLLSDSAINL